MRRLVVTTQYMNKRKAFWLPWIMGMMVLAMISCTKTDLITRPEPQNRILSYIVPPVSAAELPVTGAVDDADSTITLYLPAYLALEVMVPVITVSEGATVTPSSETVVDNLLSLMQKGESIRYTVTGKDGSKRTYTLHIIAQQQQTEVNELTTDVATPAEFSMTSFMGINFSGKNFVMENRPGLIKVVFTDAAGHDLPAVGALPLNIITTHQGFSVEVVRANAPAFVSQLANDGLYTVTVYNYAQVVKLKNPIRIIKQP